MTLYIGVFILHKRPVLKITPCPKTCKRIMHKNGVSQLFFFFFFFFWLLLI